MEIFRAPARTHMHAACMLSRDLCLKSGGQKQPWCALHFSFHMRLFKRCLTRHSLLS